MIDELEDKTPGPGQYEPRGITLNSPEGKSPVSIFKSVVASKFPCARRPVSAMSTPRCGMLDSRLGGGGGGGGGRSTRDDSNSRRVGTPGPGSY
jgi:hypothetical protein